MEKRNALGKGEGALLKEEGRVEFKELLEKRRSVRYYRIDRPLKEEEREKILLAASLIPSAMNKRPLRAYLLEDRGLIKGILEEKGQPSIGDCSALLLVYGDPEVQPYRPFLDQEAGALAENVMLMAVSLGLSTCWLGVHEGAIFEKRLLALREKLGIEGKDIPLVAIAIGEAL